MTVQAKRTKRTPCVLLTSGENRFYARPGSCDEEVADSEYGRLRFFAAAYRPRKDHVILDVGAHIGVFAVAAARMAPHGVVHAIEAERDNFALLKRNAALNRVTNLRPHRLALSDRRGVVRLYRGEENWAHSTCRPRAAAAIEDAERVAADTLTGFIGRNGINRVDYLKMNVEGAEYRILLRAATSTLRKIACMLIEFHPSAAHGPAQLAERLRACGFSISVTSSRQEPGKGWLTAWS